MYHGVKKHQFDKIKHFFKLIRVTHWIKSIFVMLGFCYTPFPGYFKLAMLASISFCFISSAVYVYNDIEDKSEDQIHPLKRHRPFAMDNISITEAIFALFGVLISGLILAWCISKTLVFILCIYLVINIAYNHFFRLIPGCDVVCIASGFMLRVCAGTIGIGIEISPWLITTATLLSLYIALNKRRLEINLDYKSSIRSVLKKYNETLLNKYIIVNGIATFATYLFYVIFARDQAFYFMLTLPFSAIALWRFAWLTTLKIQNDDPVLVFFADQLSRINLWCFIVLTFMALK